MCKLWLASAMRQKMTFRENREAATPFCKVSERKVKYLKIVLIPLVQWGSGSQCGLFAFTKKMLRSLYPVPSDWGSLVHWKPGLQFLSPCRMSRWRLTDNNLLGSLARIKSCLLALVKTNRIHLLSFTSKPQNLSSDFSRVALSSSYSVEAEGGKSGAGQSCSELSVGLQGWVGSPGRWTVLVTLQLPVDAFLGVVRGLAQWSHSCQPFCLLGELWNLNSMGAYRNGEDLRGHLSSLHSVSGKAETKRGEGLCALICHCPPSPWQTEE